MAASRHLFRTTVPLAAAAVVFASVHVAGLYVAVDVRQVPVSRLIANLERQLKTNPDNIETHINLARLHGMAYALKTDEVPAVEGRDSTLSPWYGHEPNLIPYRPRPAPNPESAAAAREHLRKALARYETALQLDSGNLLAMLGYAWTLEQAGETPRAIEQYREVIARAWPSEKSVRSAGLGKRFFTPEAAEYLIPLLDPVRDAAEIEDLRARQEQLARLPRAITPIAIPMRHDLPAAHVLDRSARVLFDADGSGLRREWTWIHRDAGWLVFDAAQNGTVSSALQWFGSVTFWLFWDNGYEALAALDDNGDGELTGPELRHLAIWHDRNQNGISDPGEVRSLSSHGIVALSCGYVPGSGGAFAAVSPEGVRFSDGRTRPSYDVILRSAATILTRR